MLFKTPDYIGIPIILSSETWYKKLLDPVFGHPEVKPLLKQIKITVSFPDYVYQSLRDVRSKLLITRIHRGAFTSYFLTVVVKYIKEKGETRGYISTVMINRRLPKTSKLLWERKNLT